MSSIILNNGVKLPQLGFGTIMQFGDQVIDNVAFALNHGYKLIDTANRYDNEVEVGLGLKNQASGVRRTSSKQSWAPRSTKMITPSMTPSSVLVLITSMQ